LVKYANSFGSFFIILASFAKKFIKFSSSKTSEKFFEPYQNDPLSELIFYCSTLQIHLAAKGRFLINVGNWEQFITMAPNISSIGFPII
jgi:hypothetical protein